MSRTLDSTYQRTIQDTPIHGKRALLSVTAYKYRCTNPDCKHIVFTEPLPFAKKSKVRTDVLNYFILDIAAFLSNESAILALKILGVDVSNDTIATLYKQILYPNHKNVIEGIVVTKLH